LNENFIIFFKIFQEESTPAFDEFLSLLGDKVRLRGFSGYRGGLDNTSNKSYFIMLLVDLQCRYAPLRSPEFRQFSGDFFADFPPEFREIFFSEIPAF
jgi:hypothetical protein